MEHGYRFVIVFAIVSEAVAAIALTILLVGSRLAPLRKPPRAPGSMVPVVRVVDSGTQRS
jgi:hypothetical protein